MSSFRRIPSSGYYAVPNSLGITSWIVAADEKHEYFGGSTLDAIVVLLE